MSHNGWTKQPRHTVRENDGPWFDSPNGEVTVSSDGEGLDVEFNDGDVLVSFSIPRSVVYEVLSVNPTQPEAPAPRASTPITKRSSLPAQRPVTDPDCPPIWESMGRVRKHVNLCASVLDAAEGGEE